MDFKRVRLLICIIFFISVAYFHNGASWNQNTRLNLIYSFIEPGPDQYSFRINRFIPKPEQNINTGDWSFFNGSYYSNKPPGTLLIGAPVYFLIYHVEYFLGFDLSQPMIQILNSYLINLFVSIIPAVVGLFYLISLLKLLKVPDQHNLIIAAAFAFCSMYFPYSTQLWGHTTAAALVIVAWYVYLSNAYKSLAIVGFFLGLSFLFDYLSIIAIMALVLFMVLNKDTRLVSLSVGGVVPAVFLLFYNWSCFGSPLVMPTAFMNPVFIDPNLKFGVFGAMSLESLWGLSFSLKRGIFIGMPFLLLCSYGFYKWCKRVPTDPMLWASLFIVIGYYLVNASFNGWHAGASSLARYQIIALPFWVIALKEVLGSYSIKLSVLPLLLLSFFNMFFVTAVGVLCPDWHPNPIFGVAYPLVLRSIFGTNFGFELPNTAYGDLTPVALPIRLQALDPEFSSYAKFTAWNLGELFGLEAFISLLPVLLLLLLSILLLYRSHRV